MRVFILARTPDASEWVLTEDRTGEEPKDIFIAMDGTPMRRVLTFSCPTWEEARELLLYCSKRLKRQTLSPHLDWDEAKLLMQGVQPHVLLAQKEKRSEPRDLRLPGADACRQEPPAVLAKG